MEEMSKQGRKAKLWGRRKTLEAPTMPMMEERMMMLRSAFVIHSYSIHDLRSRLNALMANREDGSKDKVGEEKGKGQHL